MSKKRIIYFFIVATFALALCMATGFAYYLLTPGKRAGAEQIFFVHAGSTLSTVAGELEKKEIIRSKFLFRLWARIMGQGTSIKAGEYNLSSAMPPIKILETLSRGISITHMVTIPEGFTREQIGELLEKKGLVDKQDFLAFTGTPEAAERYGISAPSLEGYLYPDTYEFPKGLATAALVDVMLKNFMKSVAPLRKQVTARDNTIEQTITLASIVERETGCAQERPLIASVFLNRLNKRMRLASDPTVIYGLEEFDGNLTKKDLRTHTPYNTYIIRGLPPGPIANPGLDAIKAVLYPAKTDYLYFVSKNDGTHHFSRTLSEHNRAVYFYQKTKRNRQRKPS
ncbi:MAG: endolytic transglycosylase MltG [Thermodesulfobacteriota bacterium]|nr:endolytic transglycosylase MltG [Thermodesulfobacteriota bacterium]